ncbi:Not1-domain-containing protein [Schizopora paradoxa]|uniref:General negative regulator of transcription subunit 1 n=1 Tax=Schizopora paradoxa TaxID=27342 RepID=A0A0H2RJ53_9AGAM|nr:Not1-domain-containing protein [Schizopora paradoxa]
MDTPPNANVHAIVKAQIVFLLSTLTEENFEQNQLQIRTLSEQHGLNTYLHFIRRMIVQAQARLSNSTTPTPTHFDPQIQLTFRLLVQEIQRLSRDPFLADRFREGVDKGEGELFRHFDLVRFVERVNLRPLERLVLASSFVATGVSSTQPVNGAGNASSAGTVRKELASQAANIIWEVFDNALTALIQSPSAFENSDLTPQQAGKLLQNLLCETEPPRESPLLDNTQRQALLSATQAKFGVETIAPVFQQILSHISLPSGTTLVQLMVQLGPDLTSNANVLRGILGRFGISEHHAPTDALNVELFSTLGRLAAEGTPMGDVGLLVQMMGAFAPNLDWSKVIESFDRPERQGVDMATLKLLIAILGNSSHNTNKPSISGFWSTWKNSLYQLKLLDALLSLPSDTFNFVNLPGRRVVMVDDVSSASPTIKALAINVQGHTWNSLDLFEVLVRLGGSEIIEVRNCVRDILDKAKRISAEIVHMGLLQVPRPWNAIQEEYLQQLLEMFLNGHPNHQLVFMRIWQIEPPYLTNALRDFYEKNPMNITRILDVAQDLKILEPLLEVRPFIFALDVAALASRREYLNLDKWLADNINQHGAEFLHAVIEFLELKAQNEKITRTSDPSAETRTMALSPQTIAIFLRVLRNNSSDMDERDVDYCIEVRSVCLQIHPRLMNLAPGSDQDPGFSVVSYSADIEAEVDSIYKQMYDEQITIDGVIALLQKTKESTNPRDHEIFSCMLHFLFDEYKFFQNFYPARELAMTGYLFGSLIQHQLVDYIPLGIAIRYVLDALQCPPDSNLFKFGLQALSRFEARLPEWRLVCQALMDIPHLAEARPDIAETVRRALASGSEQSAEQLQGFPSSLSLAEPHHVFRSVRPDDVDDGEFDDPPEEVSDKILFIINNLAPSNFDAKVEEMNERFVDAYSRWLAHYLVDQRVSIEPNNHQLYLRFLDGLKSSALMKLILHETFVKSAALLNSEKTKASSSERSVLKNLGSWLGQITLARDKPIKFKNMSFKDFLIEGSESDRLIVAIPFVCKILEACSKSKAFKPPNPWLMGIISLLAELYHFAELKLNLKFEIEVLCKALGLDMDDIEVANILRSRPPADPMAGPGLPDYVPDIDSLPMGGYDHQSQVGEGQAVPLNAAGAPDSQRNVGAHIEGILANLANSVIVNSQLAAYMRDPNFKRSVQLGIDRAVREIILPVVERSVTIASLTTRELVVKDFATESSEDRVRKAGHLAGQKLAGSLALVTCKEPLKTTLPGHIRAYLTENGFSEAVVAEQIVLLLAQENLDIACEAIEKAAMDRAIGEIDEAFVPHLEARRRHHEQRPGQPFWDPQAPQSSFASGLPDPLRVKANGPQEAQLRVYEEFGLDKRRFTSRPASALPFTRSEQAPTAMYTSTPTPDERPISAIPAEDQFSLCMSKLETILQETSIASLAVLPQTHDIRTIVHRILTIAAGGVGDGRDRFKLPLLISQKIVQYLYKTSTQLGRELYATLLEQLCQSYDEVAKEAITWLIYAEDDRKFNIPVTVTLLRCRLVSVAEEDQQLARLLVMSPRPVLQDFAVGLMRECLTCDPPIATRQQFTLTLDTLAQLVQTSRATEIATQFLDDLRGVTRQATGPPVQASATDSTTSARPDNEQLQLLLFKCFQQWVAVFQRSSSPEKSFVPYITNLTKQNILKAEDTSSFFFRVCAETSVGHYSNCLASGDFDNAFLALDAMSKLIVFIIKYHGDASGANNLNAKVHYMTKILSIVVLVVANRHEEQGPAFEQKPFFRFFSSLLSDLHGIESHLGDAYLPLLVALSDTFSSLQPVYFPGFAFSWMTLVSHRLFMPKLLSSSNRDGWQAFHKLLLALFKFMAPFLRNAKLQLASRNLYRGTLRLLLVLLHDFPDFLSEYYFSLCDVVPPRCIQLRNIIMSAFPASATLPDPHLPGMKLEDIPNMSPIPSIFSDFTATLKTGDLRTYLDQYLFNRIAPNSLAPLKERLRSSNPSGEESYNISVVNAVVMYIGVSSVAQAKAKSRTGSPLFVSTDPGAVTLSYLAANLDPEGQHHLLSAMVMHLRYPNPHTYWFSSLLLYLFSEVNDDRFREIMTKVLLERFIVHRPHPWGALMTFIELLRNPKYEFWARDFVRMVPEVALLLESVTRSVLQT